MSWAIRLLRIPVFAFLGYTGLLFFLQRPLLFPGTGRELSRGEGSPPADVEQVWLPTSFGRVEAWLLGGDGDAPGPAIIFTHGNGELIDDWAPEMRDMAALGLAVFLVEFPGYGISEGKPSRQTIRETLQVAHDHLLSRSGVDPDRLVVWGRSLGGGAAGDLTLDRPASAFILQSTFSSTPRLAWETFYAPGFLVRDKWDNVRAVEAFEGPILLMHGRTDEVIPFSHAETLAGARDGLEVTEIPCGHNDCGFVWDDIRETVLGFLREIGVV